MTDICICSISALHKEAGTMDVMVPDWEGQVITDVPYLKGALSEEIGAGDTVIVLFNDSNKTSRGVVIGEPAVG